MINTNVQYVYFEHTDGGMDSGVVSQGFLLQRFPEHRDWILGARKPGDVCETRMGFLVMSTTEQLKGTSLL